MTRSFIPFLRNLFILSGIIALCIIGFQTDNSQSTWLIPQIWTLFGFYVGMSSLVLFITAYSFRLGPEYSIMGIMAGVGVKMMLCLGLAMVFVYQDLVIHKEAFIVNFFLLYLLYTGLELYEINSILRGQKKTENR